jgi:putative SOS response-associated peptidase YedK
MTRADKLAQQFDVDEFDIAEIEAHDFSDPEQLKAALPARYNVAPGQMIPAIRVASDRPVRKLVQFKWGLVPFWAKDPNIGFKMINARAETIADKPAYREAFKTRRCLIPADGFYEWKKEGKAKQPFSFTMRDESLFAFAGIFERWKDPKGGLLQTCSILTTTPIELLQDIHDRMPAIVRPEHYELWLDPGFQNVADLSEMLRPYDASQMKRYPVSTRVNNVKYDDSECAQAVEAGGLFN